VRCPVLSLRQRLCLLPAGCALAAVLLALPPLASEERVPTARDQLLALRARDEKEFAQVYDNARAFLALPEARQEALRKLHKEFRELTPGQQKRLGEVMKRYAAWLEHLSDAERQRVEQAADKQGRLKTILELREDKWLARQPRAVREALRVPPAAAAASTVGWLLTPRPLRGVMAANAYQAELPELRADLIKRIKEADTQKAHEWLVVRRFWEELKDPGAKATMPVSAADLSPRVRDYVEHYLWPMLWPEEQKRLKDAEGKWPRYPMTLIELADRHPIALPARYGPTRFDLLPKGLQKHLTVSGMFKDGVKKVAGKFTPDDLLKPYYTKPVEQRLSESGLDKKVSSSTRFIATLVYYAHQKGINRLVDDTLPFPELWPTRMSELSDNMQEFIKPGGSFHSRLTEAEKTALIRAEGKWPEYPMKIRELAFRYGERPPWYTLPAPPGDEGKQHPWDEYRVVPRKRSDAAVADAEWPRLEGPAVVRGPDASGDEED
jgi:hypothetical protein